jgi:hypothetical protein
MPDNHRPEMPHVRDVDDLLGTHKVRAPCPAH